MQRSPASIGSADASSASIHATTYTYAEPVRRVIQLLRVHARRLRRPVGAVDWRIDVDRDAG